MDDASISLLRRDGQTVTLAASATTCTHVDGLPATLQNLVLGQDVTVVSDATGTQALSIRAGHPKIKAGEPGCGLFRGAVHGDISDTMSDGSARERAWDRGRISGLAPGWIRILRPDNVSVVSHPTGGTKVIGVSSYWRLRLGEKVADLVLKQVDPQGGVSLDRAEDPGASSLILPRGATRTPTRVPKAPASGLLLVGRQAFRPVSPAGSPACRIVRALRFLGTDGGVRPSNA